MKSITYFVLFTMAIFVVGCSGYNRALKSDDYGLKFEMANELYDGGQEVRSITLYEQIYQRMPKSGEGELSYFRIGKAYYVGKDYYMAGYYLGQFALRFSSSPKAEEALFLSAMCSVQNSPAYSLDQEETELAINDLQQFVDRFPQSSLVDSCNGIIDRLRYKIEFKSYEGVKLYAKTEGYRAAVSSALTFMEDYPRSKHREEVSFLLVKNSYLLGKNSVRSKKVKRFDQTIERYRNFVAEFPESRYTNSVIGYHDLATKDKEDFLEKEK